MARSSMLPIEPGSALPNFRRPAAIWNGCARARHGSRRRSCRFCERVTIPGDGSATTLVALGERDQCADQVGRPYQTDRRAAQRAAKRRIALGKVERQMVAEMSKHAGDIQPGRQLPDEPSLLRFLSLGRSKGKDSASVFWQSRWSDHDPAWVLTMLRQCCAVPACAPPTIAPRPQA